MTFRTDDEICRWLKSLVGTSGRSPSGAVRETNARLLMPHDERRAALAYLFGWRDAAGKEHVASTCAMTSMAYQRFLGLAHAQLDKPYVQQIGMAPAVVVNVASEYGAWVGDKESALCELPAAGDIVRIGMDGESGIHFCNVAEIDPATSALVCVDGGQVDGSWIMERRRVLVIWHDLPYLVDETTPYRPDGSPNGRRVSGRMSLAALTSPHP